MSLRPARVVALACLLVSYPTVTRAQMYGSISLGANHTFPADVTVNVPAAGLGVTYHGVQFSARPFDSPQYYNWHLGRLFGPRRRFGVEFEFTHLKVISDTSKSYAASGTIKFTAIPSDSTLPMNAEVQEYQMTHGLNFLIVNVVGRFPLRFNPRLSLIARLGLGDTLPHAETNVLQQSIQRYEFAGLGIQGSAGLAMRLSHLISLIADYQISDADPQITVVGGTGRTRALSQQVALGLAFGLAR